MHPLIRRSAQVGAVMATLALSVVAAPAGAAPPTEHKCLSPVFPGSDVNSRYGVSERIVGPPGCVTAYAGEAWVRATGVWVTATSADVQTFYENFVSAEWVTDEGTPQARQVSAGKESLRWEPPNGDGQIGTADDFRTPDGRPFIAPVSPALHPVSAGTHTNVLYVTFGAETCDGFEGGRCLGTQAGVQELYLFSSWYDSQSPKPPSYPKVPVTKFEFLPASELPR
jgi:hypothetical protein